MKKLAGSVRFWFYKQKNRKNQTEPNRQKTGKKPSQTEKTEPNRKKPSQTGKTEPNRFEPVFSLKNRTEPKPVGLNRFRFGFGFFFLKKNSVWLLFFIKTEPNRTVNTPISMYLYKNIKKYIILIYF